MNVDEYRIKKTTENITKDYRKRSENKVARVTAEAAKIARSHRHDNRMDTPTISEILL